MRLIILAAVLVGLSGCFSTSVKNFSRPSSETHFDLARDVGQLRAGHYVARFEDGRFTYYDCGKKCLNFGKFDLPGGIRLPKAGVNEPARLWIYITQSDKDMGLLINQLDKLEAGRIRVLEQKAPPVNPEVLAAIHIESDSVKDK